MGEIDIIKYMIGYVKRTYSERFTCELKNLCNDLEKMLAAAETKKADYLNDEVDYERNIALPMMFPSSIMIYELIGDDNITAWDEIQDVIEEGDDISTKVNAEIISVILVMKEAIRFTMESKKKKIGSLDEMIVDNLEYYVFNNVLYKKHIKELDLDKIYKFTNLKFEVVHKDKKLSLKYIDGQKVEDNARDEMWKKLKNYGLSEEAKKTITDFCTFKQKQRRNGNKIPELANTYYNMLVCSEDDDEAVDALKIIFNGIGIDESNIDVVNQKDVLKTIPLLIAGQKVLIIKGVINDPATNLDAGTARAQQESADRAQKYEEFWKHLSKRAKTNPDVTIVLIVNNSVLNGTVAPKNEIYHRILGHRFYMTGIDEEVILQKCLDRFKNGSVKVSAEFENAFSVYFRAIYKSADLKNDEFVDDVVNRVYSLYFRNESNIDKPLNKTCIPPYSIDTKTEEEILGDLNSMVGLKSVKEELTKIAHEAFLKKNGLVEKKKKKKGENDVMYHMMLLGNPGTGKTRVAQIIGDILYNSGIVKTKKFIFSKPSEFISPWRESTEVKTRQKLDEAYDGVLFIDEAYGLCTGTESASRALTEIIQEMVNNSDHIVIIFAGYEKDMKKLEDLNQGFSRRIGFKLYFDDYNLDELRLMFMNKIASEGFVLEETAKTLLDVYLKEVISKTSYANGGEVDILFNKLNRLWENRYYSMISSDNDEKAPDRIFYEADFSKLVDLSEKLEINKLVGLETVRAKIDEFKNYVRYKLECEKNQVEIDDADDMEYMHMLFLGNPGTGKTEVAKILAKDLFNIGFLESNKCVLATQENILYGPYGSIQTNLSKLFDEARGGVLFFDEAYFIAEIGRLGHTIIETLLPLMQDCRRNTIVILAGYPDKMHKVFEMNPGLRSRIGYTFVFDDYNANELMEIFERKLSRMSIVLSEKAKEKAMRVFEYFSELDDFGNARFVDKIIAMMRHNRAKRDFMTKPNNMEAADVPAISDMIETDVFGRKMYDPDKVTKEQRKNTAVHELGHAIVAYHLDSGTEYEEISIVNKAVSLGRIRRKTPEGAKRLDYYEGMIKVCLAGRCAEKVKYGNYALGCASDIEKAIYLVKMLNRDFVAFRQDMNFDTNIAFERKLINDYEDEVMGIIEMYMPFIDSLADYLVEHKTMSSKDFIKKIKSYQKKAKIKSLK